MRRTIAIMSTLVALAIVLIVAATQPPQGDTSVVVTVLVGDDGIVKQAQVVSCPPSHRKAIDAVMQRMIGVPIVLKQ